MVFGGGPLTPGIKALIVACVAVFLVQALVGRNILESIFGLAPSRFVLKLWLWQPLTYLFLHGTGNIFHLVINMLMLWMFGTELERRWGTQAFLQFYLVCGVGAGLLSVALDPIGNLFAQDAGQGLLSAVPTVGASGAIYGLLAAQAILFPNRLLLLFFFIPMRMRPAVLLLAGIMLFTALGTSGAGINHVAHLGGMLVAWLYLHRVWNLRKMWMEWRWRARRRKYKVVSDVRDDDRFNYH